MLPPTRKASAKSERGVALFIAIFALLLISVVALGLMLMAGTESDLNSNYKSSVQAFYDAFEIKPGDKMYRAPAERVEVW